jgi:uncharacterized membrane protein
METLFYILTGIFSFGALMILLPFVILYYIFALMLMMDDRNLKPWQILVYLFPFGIFIAAVVELFVDSVKKSWKKKQ